MVRKLNLSSEISRLRALVLGGSTAKATRAELAAWRMRHQSTKKTGFDAAVLSYAAELDEALGDAAELGGRLEPLLREVQPRVRRLERFVRRVSALRKQFGFQGAVAIVIPWGVVAIHGKFSLNFLFVAGAVFQAIGAVLFSIILARVSRATNAEQRFLLRFLNATWMRALCGFSLTQAMARALEAVSDKERFFHLWSRWFQARNAVGGGDCEWPSYAIESRAIARTLETLIVSGAPASETLSDFVAQLEEERQNVFDDRIQELPTRLALVFCASFTPAVFAILMGSLWPSLQMLMT